MAYDERLAARIRARLADVPDVVEKHMFGGLAFLVCGHMCVGAHGGELIARVGVPGEDVALARLGARPMDFTGRPMSGWVTVASEGLGDDALEGWVATCVAFVATLPPKRGPA